MPASSASPGLKAIVFWAVDQCLMARIPRGHTPPHVDRLVSRRPAKSVSANARRMAPSSCHGKW
eukprot:13690778-Alexandrium_andersonii.AAC.1